MSFSPEFAAGIAIVLALIAYALGRNPVLWFFIGYLLPAAAWLLLLLRHGNRRKVSPMWVLNIVNRAKLKMWARDLKPEDFDDGPSGGAQK
jgi:hypothetical protein